MPFRAAILIASLFTCSAFSQQAELDKGYSRYSSGFILVAASWFSPAGLTLSPMWFGWTSFAGLEAVGQVGFWQVHAGIEQMRLANIAMHGAQEERMELEPSHKYVIGNVFKAAGAGLVIAGAVTDNKDYTKTSSAGMIGGGVLCYLIGDIAHMMHLFNQAEDADYYRGQIKDVDPSFSALDRVDWTLQPFVLPVPGRATAGMAFAAQF